MRLVPAFERRLCAMLIKAAIMLNAWCAVKGVFHGVSLSALGSWFIDVSMAYPVHFCRCLLILMLFRPILASSEKESCTLSIFRGLNVAVTCSGSKEIDKWFDWETVMKERPPPIDIAPGIKLFGEVADTEQRTFFHIENRTLELTVEMMTNDRKSLSCQKACVTLA